MNILEAIILGVLQGLTEFLPVSSSGHLELANYLFGIEQSGGNLQFTAAVHAGTVLSTIIVFWREIIRLFRGVFQFRLNDETVFLFNILISLLPIIFVGFMLREHIEALFNGNIMLVGCMLLVTAGLLAFSYYTKPGQKPVTPKRAFIMGIAQAIAVIPGISRSGATISAGLLQGVKRDEVSKFSFLMVLIPIIGMNLLELFDGGLQSGAIPAGNMVAGFLAAFVTGTLACRWMISLVNKGRLIWFALYCFVIGIMSISMYIYGG